MSRKSESVSRRRFLGGAGAVVGATLLGAYGCSGDDDDDAEPTTSPSQSATATSEPVQRGGTLRIPFNRDPSTFFPLLNGGWGTDVPIMLPLFDRLFEYDSSLRLDAARSLVAAHEHPDTRTYTLQLRPGVTFHDGTPFNAEAVASHLRLAASHPSSVAKGDVAAIESIETSDELTVTLHLSRGMGDYPLTLAGRAGAVVSPASIEEYGDEIGVHPVGTGAFRLETLRSGSGWTYIANPEYWGSDLPYLDGIEVSVVSEEQVAAAGLRSGELDAYSAQGALATQFDLLEAADGITTHEQPGVMFGMFYMNGTRAPFDNPMVAQAVNFAMNRTEIAESMSFGHGWASQGFIPQDHPYFDEAFQPFPAEGDIAEAKRLLSAAGYEDGLNFVMDTFNLSYFPRVAQLMQDQLRAAGINVEIRQQDGTTGTARIFSLDMDMVFSQWSGRANLFETISALYHTTGAYNSGPRVINADFDRLVEAIGDSTDEARNQELYRELQVAVAADGRNAVFGSLNVLGYSNARVGGFALNPDSGARLHNVWLKS